MRRRDGRFLAKIGELLTTDHASRFDSYIKWVRNPLADHRPRAPGGERAEAVLIGASAALGTISLALGFRRHRSGRDAAGLGLLWSRGASIGGELPPMGSRCEVDRSSEVMPSERTGTRRRSRRRI